MRVSRTGLGPLVMALGMLCAGAGTAWPQVPDGYFQSDSPVLPDSLVESYEDGRFKLLVVREAPDSLGHDLIRQAERLFPEAALIEESAAAFLEEMEFGGAWPENMKEAEEAGGVRWWWHRFDRVWLPFALTGDAVQHYVEGLRGLVRTPYGEPDAVKSGSFEYRARVGREGGLPVVHLYARWSNYCGSLCALGFTHERWVYFDAGGGIQRVEGDQAPHYWVS